MNRDDSKKAILRTGRPIWSRQVRNIRQTAIGLQGATPVDTDNQSIALAET
jgi:hypothetical protein